MYIETLSAVFLPFLGTLLGSACVFFMKGKICSGSSPDLPAV